MGGKYIFRSTCLLDKLIFLISCALIIVIINLNWTFCYENIRDHSGYQIADLVVPMGNQIFDFSSRAASPDIDVTLTSLHENLCRLLTSW